MRFFFYSTFSRTPRKAKIRKTFDEFIMEEKLTAREGGENGPIVTKNEAQLCSLFSSLDRSENYNCVQDRMELLFLP